LRHVATSTSPNAQVNIRNIGIGPRMTSNGLSPCGVLDDWCPASPIPGDRQLLWVGLCGKSLNLRDFYPDGIQLVITVEDRRQPDPTSRELVARYTEERGN